MRMNPGTRIQLSKAKPITETLHVMARLVRRRRDDRQVRDMALRITAGCPPVDDPCRMSRVRGWVKGAVMYERDPRGGDLLHDPVDMINRIAVYGSIGGDCDDASILQSALLETLGIATRFTAISTRPDRRLHHVVVEAADKLKRWHWLDAFGQRRPHYTNVLRVNV